MEYKNCCLKRCEDCSLKILVFKKYKNMFGTCVWFKTKADTFDQNKHFLIQKTFF